MLIQHTLENISKTFPEKICLKFRNETYTYSEFDRKTNQIARGLKNLGVNRGDRVLVYLENRPEVLLSVYGILKADAVFVIINTNTKLFKLKYIVRNSTPVVIITSAKAFRNQNSIASFLTECPSVHKLVFIDNEREDEELDFTEFKYESDESIEYQNINIDLAGLIYTSGSTGFPMGVTMAHYNILSACDSIIEYLHNTPDDIILDVLPLSFDYGLYQAFMCFKFGGTLVLEHSLGYIQPVLKIIEDEEITGFPCVPTIFSLFFQLKNIKDYRFKNLRYMTNTGSALSPEHIRTIRSNWPHVQLYSMYGLTECKRVSYLEPDLIDQKPDSVGTPMPNLDVKIINESGEEIGTGEIGELIVRGSTIMQGYWNDKKATDEAIKPGRYPQEKFLHTGDYFVKDSDSLLYFRGRNDDMLKIKGERVSPREIESVINRHVNVVDSAVIGLDDPVKGKYIRAYVILISSKKNKEIETVLTEYCQLNLESHAMPREFVFLSEITRDRHGKVDREALLALG